MTGMKAFISSLFQIAKYVYLNNKMFIASEPHLKFYVPTPISSSSIQETSDEGSVQFDSSSEESKIRYVIRVLPNKWYRDLAVTVEVSY